jgi:hypothetical protein
MRGSTVNLRQELTLLEIERVIQQQADHISETQLPSGAIPWYHQGIADPWDHVECAIALDASRRFEQAEGAYRWLRSCQNPDGSWWSSYMNGLPQDFTRDTNYSSYPAVGLWYHYLLTGDIGFVAEMWPVIERGICFALELQQPAGQIYWARDAQGVVYPLALMAASSCIFQSLRCGVRIAHLLGLRKPQWVAAGHRLARAISEQPELFHNSVDSQYDYAMSWYYPVLTGIIRGQKAKDRIIDKWSDFVVNGWGCKCVAEEPWWITVAETCELVLALNRIGEHDKASLLLDWALELKDEDGRFWTGMKMPEEEIWPPEEKPTWVSAAMIIALTSQIEAAGVGKGTSTIFSRFL